MCDGLNGAERDDPGHIVLESQDAGMFSLEIHTLLEDLDMRGALEGFEGLSVYLAGRERPCSDILQDSV